VPAAAAARDGKIRPHGYGPGSVVRATAYGARRMKPPACRRSSRTTTGRLPAPRPATAQRRLCHAGTKPLVGFEMKSRSGSRLSAWRLGRFPPRWIVASQAGLAFPLCRMPLPVGALFGSESAARGRVAALVAVVPADAIARQGITFEYFLNDTRAGSAVR